MDAIIRPAKVEDAQGIARVHTQSWRETYAGLMAADFLASMTDETARQRREANWQTILSNPEKVVYIAELSGEVVAFASGGEAPQHPGYDAELYTLYSLKRVQGQGIGKALLQALAQELLSRGAKNMALWVLDVNPTRGWYARHGAREAGEKTQDDLHEIRMVWDDLSVLL